VSLQAVLKLAVVPSEKMMPVSSQPKPATIIACDEGTFGRTPVLLVAAA
jgi:hypothetical protein